MVPARLRAWQRWRLLLERIKGALPLPNVSPDLVGAMQLPFSLLFVLVYMRTGNLWASEVALGLALLLDGLDGTIARRYQRTSERGYVFDVVMDRLSEHIVLIPFFRPWILLATANTVLALIGFRNGRHLIVPLRVIVMLGLPFWGL